MRPEKIREALRAQPFRRLRVFLSDGTSHEVPHPDFAYLTVHQLIIARDVDPAGIPRTTLSVDPLHVTHIEMLPEDGNGT
jgi:hypothetical protein